MQVILSDQISSDSDFRIYAIPIPAKGT